MDLSVIIPVHNLENYLLPMLVSLNLQDLEDKKVELIFVCDNCTDKTQAIIEKFGFCAPYDQITIIKCNVNSCGLARNEGFEEATGKYIMFLDGDDWLLSNKTFLNLLNFMEENNYQMCRFLYDAPGFSFPYHPAMVWQYIYHKTIIDDTRFTSIQPHEDLEFNTIIAKKIGGFNNIPLYPVKLYHYNYMREGSNIHQLVTKGKIIP